MGNRICNYFKKNFIGTISVVCFLFIFLPYIIVATYAGPSADDFSNLNNTLSQGGSSFLVNAVRASIYTYKNWQGTYFGNTATFIGGAIFHYGGMTALHIEYVLNIFIFFASCLYLFWTIFGHIFQSFSKRFNSTFLLTSLFCLMVLYDYDVSEVFYWHTGLAIYTLPVSFTLLSIAIVLKKNVTKKEIFIAAILTVFAAGGSLLVSAFVTGTIMLIVIYKSYEEKKVDKTVICFLTALIGSLTNTLAPGNFIRHARLSDDFPVFSSIRYGLVNTFKALWEYVGNGTVILILCACLLLFNSLKESRIKFINPVLLMLLLYIGSAIIEFPLYLGYAAGGMLTRCLFVRKTSMALFMTISALNLTGWISRRTKSGFSFSHEYVTIIISLFFVASVSVFPHDCWDNTKPFKIWNDI